MRACVHSTAGCFRTPTFSGRSRAASLENDTVLPLSGLLRQVPRCLAAYRSSATALRSTSAACGSTEAALWSTAAALRSTSAAYRFTAAVLCSSLAALPWPLSAPLRPLSPHCGRGRLPLNYGRSPTAAQCRCSDSVSQCSALMGQHSTYTQQQENFCRWIVVTFEPPTRFLQ